MQLGMIGLGRMGAFMAQRLIRGGHTIIGYVRHAEPWRLSSKKGPSQKEPHLCLTSSINFPRHVPSG